MNVELPLSEVGMKVHTIQPGIRPHVRRPARAAYLCYPTRDSVIPTNRRLRRGLFLRFQRLEFVRRFLVHEGLRLMFSSFIAVSIAEADSVTSRRSGRAALPRQEIAASSPGNAADRS
jgi:hypothetical protein